MSGRDFLALPDYGLDWLDAGGPHADVAISSRVRLARNLAGGRYAARATGEDREAVLATVSAAVRDSTMRAGAHLLRLDRLPRRTQRLLLERRLVSAELVGEDEPQNAAGVAVRDGDGVSVMINEEDHLRLQCFSSGLAVRESWSRVDRLDDDLGSQLHFAYHQEFGFLTACPTNAGTGLRASVLLHLPGLVLTREVDKVIRGVSRVGLTTRGLHGEGSEYLGNFFQISNQTTLGQTEQELVDQLLKVVETVVRKERDARRVLMRDAGAVTEDKIWRAYGLLRHARSLPYREMLNLLSGVRLGVAAGLLPSPPLHVVNRIMIFAQAAHLEEAAGQPLSKRERQAHRAGCVRAALKDAGSLPTTDPGPR